MSTVTYCDLCLSPIKPENSYIMFCSNPREQHFATEEEYAKYITSVSEKSKEICPRCKQIFDKIFELRLTRLQELTEEINLTFNKQSVKNPKERKDVKKKRQSKND